MNAPAPILVATDLSPAAALALAVADARCRRTGAPLVVCHAMPDESKRVAMIFPHEYEGLPEEETVRAAVDAVVDQVEASTGRTEDEFELRLGRGTASKVIAQAASETSAQLIVVAHGNKGMIARAVIGSTTEQLAAASPTSLLVVREGPEEGEEGVVVTTRDPGEESAPSMAVAQREARAADVGVMVVTKTDPVTAAEDQGASLIVIEATSENDDPVDIVRRAPCSVLIVGGTET